MKNQRNSNIELLRIISMFLIVMHHFSFHGINLTNTPISIDRLVYNWLVIGGKLGVDIFVIITGYYMCKSKYTLKKFLKVALQTIFYSLGIFILFRFFVNNPYCKFDSHSLIRAVFPISFYEYWFVSTFILLMIITPFLNNIINEYSKEKLLKVIIIAVLICSVIPTYFSNFVPLGDLGWFAVLYLISGYLRLYPIKVNKKVPIVLSIILYFSIIVLFTSSLSSPSLQNLYVLALAISMFLAFEKMQPHYSKIINIIASAAFGVYLIHDNNYMRPYLWKKILNVQNLYGTGRLFFYAILIIPIVYIACTIIELIRIYTIDKIIMKKVDKILPNITKKIDEYKKCINTLKTKNKRKKYIFTKTNIRIAVIVGIVLFIVIALQGSKFISIHSGSGKTELLFNYIRYLTSVIYLFVPMFIVCIYACAKYRLLFKKENKVFTIGRFLITMAIIILINYLYIRRYHDNVVLSYISYNYTAFLVWIFIQMIVIICLYTNKEDKQLHNIIR